jgi:hypothetical protein
MLPEYSVQRAIRKSSFLSGRGQERNMQRETLALSEQSSPLSHFPNDLSAG